MEYKNTDTLQNDDLIIAQEKGIQEQIATEQKLVGNKQDPSCLRGEYENNPMTAFVSGVEYLSQTYESIRRIRGDGNCFYRGFLFGYLEQLLLNLTCWGEAELERVTSTVEASKDRLVELGYSEIAIETFWEVFVDELTALPSKTVDDIDAMFNEEGGNSDYLVWYCRLLAAGHLKANSDQFLPFLEGMDVETFCKSEVEPMGKECEQVQIIALTAALDIPIRIEYLDGREFTDSLNQLVFPEGREPLVTLLYRPGHYDILSAEKKC
mmetsp:Transcript_28681/g.37596  ORF Transcript_28681/g.37596 Transcript_28681/m.37596 type:complete len:267 (+) Transcript_28681:100-900(+)